MSTFVHFKCVFLENSFWLEWKELKCVLLPNFIKEDYEVSLQTTVEVDRAHDTTESAQKEGNKGKDTEFAVQGVCTKTISMLSIGNIDQGIPTTKRLGKWSSKCKVQTFVQTVLKRLNFKIKFCREQSCHHLSTELNFERK